MNNVYSMYMYILILFLSPNKVEHDFKLIVELYTSVPNQTDTGTGLGGVSGTPSRKDSTPLKVLKKIKRVLH